jgi:flagellin FlaB
MKHADAGFTGLEAAIVLIAFVVVAAVFSYVVLGAGFFTTQKSQQVVHTGVEQSSSTINVIGNVYGIATSSGANVSVVNFTVALAPGGTPVDFSQIALTYSDPNNLVILSNAGWGKASSSSGQWSVVSVLNNATVPSPTSELLQPGEQFLIMTYPLTNGIAPNTIFNIELKPSIGPSLTITRTIPGGTSLVNILY